MDKHSKKELQRKLYAKETMELYLQAALEHKKVAILSLLLPIAAVVMNVGVPYFASKVLAGLVTNGDEYMKDFYFLVIISAIGVIMNRVAIANSMRIQPRIMQSLGQKAYRGLINRGAGYHGNNVSGKLVSDVVDFYDSFGLFFTSAFIKGLGFASILVVGLIVLTIDSWQLGLAVFVMLSFIVIWTFSESRVRSSLRVRRQIAAKDLASHVSDTIVNILTVKTFAGEDKEIQNNTKYSNKLASLQETDWVRTVKSESHRIALVVGMQLLVVFVLIQIVQDNPAVLATGIFAFTYTLTLLGRFFEINTITRQAEESLLKASPMTQMLLEDVEIKDKDNATKLEVYEGNIELKNITFAYESETQQAGIFKDLNLSIKAGEKVGIVGPSGGGKSTLTRLLMRFEDLNDGQILIDGQNIANVTQKTLRSSIAYVPQEPLLFHRSIRENILYAKPEANNEELENAAQQANADDFISSLPNGYDTIVGERGIKLSGGQRQRVAIARALLKNSKILILDEATSALDSESESMIQQALSELMKHRTTIVIAHRLSTIQRMDRIIVIDNGKIVQEGSHAELLNSKGIYSKLWAHQSGGFLED